jgi:hypothetical protein
MSADFEHTLRAELMRRAEQTTTSATALSDIGARAATHPEPGAKRRSLRPRTRPSPAPHWETWSWRRPLVAVATAMMLLAMALVAVQWGAGERADDPDVRLPSVQPLPDRPPAIEGTLVGGVSSLPCGVEYCVDGSGIIDLASPEAVHRLTERPLRDGRQVASRSEGWWVTDPQTGEGVKLTNRYPIAVDVLTDGRVATYLRPYEDRTRAELVVVDPAGARTTHDLPEGFSPYGLAAGPEAGWSSSAVSAAARTGPNPRSSSCSSPRTARPPR